MILKKTYEFELEIMDVIEDVIIHRDETITILIRRSSVNPKSDQFQLTMSFNQGDLLLEKLRKAEEVINEIYAEALEERRRVHAK